MRGYDQTFLLNCQWKTKLLDKDGNIHEIHLSYSDNNDRLSLKESPNVEYIATTTQAYVQDNPTTGLRLVTGQRILIWDDLANKWLAYEVRDAEAMSMKGLISVQFGNSQIIDGDDNLELGIANYRTQMEKITQTNPSEPTLTNVILGADEVWLTTPYQENPYTLNNIVEPYTNTWSITPMDGVELVQHDKKKCYIGISDNTELANQVITLKATINGIEHTKEIKIIGY